MMEVRDPNSNAILFKRTEREKRVDDMEDTIRELQDRLSEMEKIFKNFSKNGIKLPS